ncbi:MAG: hypothetical protein UX23_C0012G0019 [Parcubacteria group bacterium GW2011_GWB1_45_9]|nr:MAG: hypothetical protein UX23_C0012G0019 [Parcubacteria group bacterium GW2011_GWB1_45_9]
MRRELSSREKTETAELAQGAIFKPHALERLVERMKYLNNGVVPKDPEKTARKILASATEDGAISPIGKIKRLLSHKRGGRLEEARYFINENIRFVVVKRGEQNIVVTIEIAYFK